MTSPSRTTSFAAMKRTTIILFLVLLVCGWTSADDDDSFQPTAAPVKTTPPSDIPSLSPTITPMPTVSPAPTEAPSPEPTDYRPTAAPTVAGHHFSFWAILGKTIAWCIIILLVFLAFGAIMSNRYRIYYFLRGAWYTIQNWNCTRTLWLRLTGRDVRDEMDAGLNTIIFEDNPEMSEGLLLRETD